MIKSCCFGNSFFYLNFHRKRGCFLRTTSFSILQLVANVGQKSSLTSTLDSSVELTLVNSASAGHSSGQDLAALADELAELSGILVIDISNLIGAENANLLSSANNGARRTRNVFSHLMNPPI
jgi:hypothetical protein